MSPVKVIADSACDLPASLLEEHGIAVVPLSVRFGDEELVDRRDLSAAEFWARLDRSSQLPETAAPSPGAFEQAYRQAGEEGCDGVVCVTLSAALSATHQAAEVAANAMRAEIPVRVVDSRTVTLAQGLMAVKAAEASRAGLSLDEVAGVVQDLIPRSRVFATLDTLENLRKGGRIGGAQALLGSMLSIKPVIQVADGKVEPESRQRTRARALRYLAEKVRQSQPVEDLCVVHGNAPDVEQLMGLLSSTDHQGDIRLGDVGAVIGTHAGPGVIGVCFFLPG